MGAGDRAGVRSPADADRWVRTDGFGCGRSCCGATSPFMCDANVALHQVLRLAKLTRILTMIRDNIDSEHLHWGM